MLSNQSEFEVLLTRYDDDPATCSKLLRTHALTQPKVFLSYAQKALLAIPVSRALKFITGLAISAGVMDELIETYSRSRIEALSIAQKLIACEPRFDVIFLDFLQKSRPPAGEENFIHAGLDILDSISQGDILVPGVLKLLKHPNPKIGSKAALFIGSRTQNLAWASRTQEYDARVRANIMESLYGVSSDFVRNIFIGNLNDDNNRVAGNAVFGLYQLGDTSAIPMIHDMARHPDPRFRNTCAWIMGRTADPRFAQAFSELMNDPNELVRAQALKGLSEVRKALRASASGPQLKCAIVKMDGDEEPAAVTVVHDASGQPIRGIRATSFIVKAGTPAKVARQYAVEEYERHNSLSVGFVCSLPANCEDEADATFIHAVQTCHDLRRPKDRWSIVKLSAQTRPSRFGAPAATDLGARYRQKWSLLNIDLDTPPVASAAPPDHPTVEYSIHQSRIEAMQREKPIMLGSGPGDEVSELVVNSLLRVEIGSGNPHVIFIGAGPCQQLVDVLSARGADLPATVHILAHSSAWQTDEVRELAQRSGGCYRVVSNTDALADACFELYSSLLHNYRVTWKDGAGNLELDIYSEYGKAAARYEPAVADLMPILVTA